MRYFSLDCHFDYIAFIIVHFLFVDAYSRIKATSKTNLMKDNMFKLNFSFSFLIFKSTVNINPAFIFLNGFDIYQIIKKVLMGIPGFT